TLVKGKVKISDIADEKSIGLEPGEQAALNYKSGKYSVRKVEVAHYTAWKDGLFSFQSAPLSEIMRKLSRWYNCDFQFEDSSLENLHFTGTLDKHQNLKDLLLLISETCSVDFHVNKENTIIISSK
nr:DUF4974 domain-containing protein [Salinivirgaceae bacterium]